MVRLLKLYKELRKLVGMNMIQSDATLNVIMDIYAACQGTLSKSARINLNSKIAGKEYFSFAEKSGISRAINYALYSEGVNCVDSFFVALKRNTYSSSRQITSACYAIAISFCAIIDMSAIGNQKTHGTFFEYFIGHLFSRRIGVLPTRELPVLNLGMSGTLPTDFIFDLGIDKLKFHVPVKLSTRERVIQVWAHQRVLDGVYGMGRFLGTLVCLCETKTDKGKGDVVEICLPFQWQLYQMFISQLTRIYYLDLPNAYASLNFKFPKIKVCPFGDFFLEADSLLE
jgi:hypothetical protein